MVAVGPVLIVLLLTIGCVPTAPQFRPGAGGAASSTRRAPRPRAPKSGALLGTWIAPRSSSWSRATQERLWRQRESDAGRRFDIGHSFYRWSLPFPSWKETWHAKSGRIPMVSWNGTSTSAILSGRYDGMIRQRARAMRDLKTPVFLRFFWEMDGAWQRARTETPKRYVAAWRRVHQIFKAERATNVAWVWCPNAWGFEVGLKNVTRWYPGHQYVNWVCADGYNWAPTKATARWTSFYETYKKFYAWAKTKGKPLMVGEFGAIENNPGQKAKWIANAGLALKTKFPKIRAVVYYDEYRYESGTVFDWRLDSTAGAYAAWNKLTRDPYFNQR